MKKILLILVVLLCICSCSKKYKCVLKYEVSYPDTTWVNTCVFDGNFTANAIVYKTQDGRKVLYVYPTCNDMVRYEIAAVPGENMNITIHDFKIYRYGVDIPKKEKK